MQCLRSVVFSVAALLLSALPAPAEQQQAQDPARFQQTVENGVKPGQEMVFENYVKKLVEGANKAGSKQTWTAYMVQLGKPGATYRIALTFRSWADRDAWSTIPAMMAKAFGQAEAQRIMQEGGSAVERSISEVWENLPAQSSNQGAPPGDTAPDFVRVAIIRVQPAMVGAYEALAAKFKAAYEAAPSKPAIARSILRFGLNSGSTYRRTQVFRKWSELDAMNPAEIILKQYGAEAGAKMIDELRRMTISEQEFISVRRADLSRTAPQSTSSQ